MTTADQDAFDVEALIGLLYLIADAKSICDGSCDEEPLAATMLSEILSNAQAVGNALLVRASARETRARGVEKAVKQEKTTYLICGHA